MLAPPGRRQAEQPLHRFQRVALLGRAILDADGGAVILPDAVGSYGLGRDLLGFLARALEMAVAPVVRLDDGALVEVREEPRQRILRVLA